MRDHKEPRDRVENFHGNQLVYLHWAEHLMIAAPIAFPLPPAMPFGALTGELIPKFYGMHPDWKQVDLAKAEWTLDGKRFSPDFGKSLADNGVGHKSVIQFKTPGLDGYKHSAS